MITVHSEAELRRHVGVWHHARQSVGLVPTMGALHEGHLSLVDRARELVDRVVVSLFVNPSQFGPGEDLDRYPRTPERDAQMLGRRGVDLLFAPRAEDVYPQGFVTWIDLEGPPAHGLEAAHRPGHFRGVATVVTMLLNLVQPELAVFGEKDAQQLAVVRRLVGDLKLPVKIIAGPTVREDDGLAMSSRNVYLEGDDRRRARVLYRALQAARDAFESGERRAAEIRKRLRDVFATEPEARLEYAEVIDASSFEPVEGKITRPVVLPVAARVGATRLIDNVHLRPEGPRSHDEDE